METLWQDLRYGIRVLRMRPGFATAAIVTLAIGIGANTAIFGAVHAMLLAPLPIAQADRVVYGIALREGFDPFGTSFLEYGAYRNASRSFVAHGLATRRAFTLVGHDEPERLEAVEAMAGFMDALGVAPVAGRMFTRDEDRPGGPPVALIGYDVWHRRFGGDVGAIGRRRGRQDRRCGSTIACTPSSA